MTGERPPRAGGKAVMGQRRGTPGACGAAGRFFGRSAVGLVGVTGAATVLGMILGLLRSGLRALPRFDYDTAATIDDALRERSGVLTTVVGLGQNGILWWLVTVGTVIMIIHRRLRLAAYVMVT